LLQLAFPYRPLFFQLPDPPLQVLDGRIRHRHLFLRFELVTLDLRILPAQRIHRHPFFIKRPAGLIHRILQRFQLLLQPGQFIFLLPDLLTGKDNALFQPFSCPSPFEAGTPAGFLPSLSENSAAEKPGSFHSLSSAGSAAIVEGMLHRLQRPLLLDKPHPLLFHPASSVAITASSLTFLSVSVIGLLIQLPVSQVKPLQCRLGQLDAQFPVFFLIS
jgi:hypothetical protein